MTIDIPRDRPEFSAVLVDAFHEVVAEALPDGIGGGGGARSLLKGIAEPSVASWSLTAPQLADGTYYLRVRGLESGDTFVVENTNPLPPPPPPVDEIFRRGDANTDGVVNISDPVQTLNYLFAGAENSDVSRRGGRQ